MEQTNQPRNETRIVGISVVEGVKPIHSLHHSPSYYTTPYSTRQASFTTSARMITLSPGSSPSSFPKPNHRSRPRHRIRPDVGTILSCISLLSIGVVVGRCSRLIEITGCVGSFSRSTVAQKKKKKANSFLFLFLFL